MTPNSHAESERPPRAIADERGSASIEPEPRSLNGGLGSARYLERAEDGSDVRLDRAFGQSELAADHLVGRTFRNQPEYLALANCQAKRLG